MNGDAAISWPMFFTLSAGVVVSAALLISFLRSRHNREIAAYALEGDGRSQGGEPSGAATELLALAAAAAIAMALLTVGYASRGDMKIKPVNSSAANNQLAQLRTDPNTPKPYQPENPAPDPRSAVTGAPTGVGSDNGGRPEQEPKR